MIITSAHAALTSLQTALAGRYVFERELGRGGMATVYLARDLEHDRDVALKVLIPELAMAVGTERFFREIEVATTLRHPRIIGVLDSGRVRAPAGGPDGILYSAGQRSGRHAVELARQCGGPVLDPGRFRLESGRLRA